MVQPKYPNIKVKLVGTDGNAIAIISKVKRALIVEGVPAGETDKFFEEATSGDYDNVLQTCMKWVDVE